MKIYSDVLTSDDLYDTLPPRVTLHSCERLAHTRVRARGWEVSLSGTSPYTSQMGEPHKAATWTEHGVWMAALYKKDPQARIGHYKTLEEFLVETKTLSEHPGNNIGKRAAHFRAPWLEDEDLLALRLEAMCA